MHETYSKPVGDWAANHRSLNGWNEAASGWSMRRVLSANRHQPQKVYEVRMPTRFGDDLELNDSPPLVTFA